MGYAQDMHLKLINSTGHVLRPASLTLSWGKRYRWDMDAPYTEDKSHAMPTSSNLPSFGPGQPKNQFWLACCGKENASSGTEGDLILRDGDDKFVMRIHFNVPYGLNMDEVRKISFHEVTEGYEVRNGGWMGGGVDWIGRDVAVEIRYRKPRPSNPTGQEAVSTGFFPEGQTAVSTGFVSA